MFTWYSTIFPPSQRTCCSLTHAPRTLRSVFAARVMPCWIASSKLFDDVALISDTLATDIPLSAPAESVNLLPDQSTPDPAKSYRRASRMLSDIVGAGTRQSFIRTRGNASDTIARAVPAARDADPA